MSNTIQRLDPWGYDDMAAYMKPDNLGDYVRYDEHQGELNELKTKLDTALKMLEYSVEMLREGDFSTGYCCCGDSMSHPGISYGHSPVDEGGYHAGLMIKQIEEFLEKQLTPTINPV